MSVHLSCWMMQLLNVCGFVVCTTVIMFSYNKNDSVSINTFIWFVVLLCRQAAQKIMVIFCA
jgi:hypothetical protein